MIEAKVKASATGCSPYDPKWGKIFSKAQNQKKPASPLGPHPPSTGTGATAKVP